MEAINLITGISLILIGIIIKHGKMYNLIAGYNTMPKEKKKNVDISGFSTLLRNCFVIIGVLIIAGHYILSYFGLLNLTHFLILFSICGILPVLLIQGKKYDKN